MHLLGYLKLLFSISRIIFSDIRNYAKKAFYLRNPKTLFWISKTTVSDIRKLKIYLGYKKSYFGYPK